MMDYYSYFKKFVEPPQQSSKQQREELPEKAVEEVSVVKEVAPQIDKEEAKVIFGRLPESIKRSTKSSRSVSLSRQRKQKGVEKRKTRVLPAPKKKKKKKKAGMKTDSLKRRYPALSKF